MSGRKKKLSAKLKQYNVLLIIALVVLMLLLAVLMIVKMVHSDIYYEVESREENIAKSKLEDTPDHETIGWLRVQGTNIDYPVYGLLSADYDYPVVTPSYTWSLNEDTVYHKTMIVYGHNVMNLGPKPELQDEDFVRMEELMGFIYVDFAKENQYIQLTIDGKDYLYKIFSVRFSEIDELNHYAWSDLDADEARAKYFDFIKEGSIYDYDVDVNQNDRILSVVTCSRFFGTNNNNDFIVTGRLVRDNEKIEQYSVLRNKNYEKVVEVLKGDGKDESEDDA